MDPLGLVYVYRNLPPGQDPSKNLQARQPGRDMSPAGHIMNGSRKDFKGSQFMSTTTDPNVAAEWRQPGQVTVGFDTDDVVPDRLGNRRIVDVSTPENAEAEGLRGRPYSRAVASKEVLVEGEVPTEALDIIDPEEGCE
jgi:hypothetical protein